MKSWFNTETPVRSEKFMRLLIMGRAYDIQRAIEEEKKSNTRTGSFNGITVKRLG